MIQRFRKRILFGDTGVTENYNFLRKEREIRSGKLQRGGKSRAGPLRESAIWIGRRSQRR